MSMLAEPRRRQRIGPNPRGKFYGEQDKNFGKSLLEKMGWKNGDGLGLERQGITEAIRPKIQMSSKGLGYDPKENPWVEHNREFEEILKGLQAEGTLDSTVQIQTEKGEIEVDDQTQKLERKSKKSRARIHYHKLVKGKDLSRASSDDMRSILGTTSFQETVDVKEATVVTVATTSEFKAEPAEGNIINKGSMVDYFQRKMKEKALKMAPMEPEPIPKQEVKIEAAYSELLAESDDTGTGSIRYEVSELEEQLKSEMDNLQNGKKRTKQKYFSSLSTVSKKFKGSNIHKLKGYTLY